MLLHSWLGRLHSDLNVHDTIYTDQYHHSPIELDISFTVRSKLLHDLEDFILNVFHMRSFISLMFPTSIVRSLDVISKLGLNQSID